MNEFMTLDIPKPSGNGHSHYHEHHDGHNHTPVGFDPQTEIAAAVRAILAAVGEDPNRDGLIDTPDRVARAYGELLEGYGHTVEDVIGDALFDVPYGEGEMVVVGDIPYSSLCEHHLLPFTGKVQVAYLPGAHVVGLSKIPRLVEMYARRLQVQEHMTGQIADALSEALGAAGVMVVVEGQHSCAALRGVKKHGVNMVTTARRGAFKTDAGLRDEFFRLIGR